ncbi:MAG TPA: class I SAM-dependent methyltransferase [Actinomycetes bacterium]|nr:class I SAM-dependent methyltransferase [Actinomycetes bacterium]
MTEFEAKEYWETRLAEHPGLRGVGFVRLGRRYNEWLYRVRRHVFLRHVRAVSSRPSDVDVLDVGSGTGFYLDLWRELGVRSVVGSDLTEVAVHALRRRNPGVEVHQLDIGGDLGPLAGREFGIVSAMDVLFHIVEDDRFERAIKQVRSLLGPGGLFIWSDNFVHQQTVRIPHQVSRSLDSIEGTLGACGLEVVERRPMFVLMNGPADTRSPLLKGWWLALRAMVSLGEPMGRSLGALLYPVELLLTRLLRESASTELMICRAVG